ncbi:hypothetical protein QYE76_015310 [Lolium multiflorum]|uniref:F-box domain-containing protein n=1 Tax=Lolium multiflorum TaxID=4521 RepID=A0AAD8X6A8_LOLMU|nr:hypothetical protein QYE76_015310 [Lolium multiflorum]
MAAVIGVDDLLREILLRLDFPAFLVRAALVSKRWLALAAHPAFLRRFRDRHPPRLLGFYYHDACSPRPQFVPVSEAPELHTAVSRAGFDDCDPSVGPFGCHNGRLLLKPDQFAHGKYVVRSPLCPMRGLVPVSPPPLPEYLRGYGYSECFLSRDSSDGIVFVYLVLIDRKLSLQVSVLQSGSWGECILAEGHLPLRFHNVWMEMVAHGKLYMRTDSAYIYMLDFVAPCPRFVTIKLPDEVGGNYKLSSADDGGFFLIHGEGFQLSLWHHETDDNGQDNWELVDRFCVRVAHDRCEEILVLGAGDNAEFVFLGLQESRSIICVNLRSRKETVYKVKVGLFWYVSVFPFMTVWPPIFPALKEEDDHDE